MIAKSPCQFCGVNIEFDVEAANSFISCPACAKQTRLMVPSTPRKPVDCRAPSVLDNPLYSKAGLPKWDSESIEDRLESIGKFFFWGGMIAALLLLLFIFVSIADGDAVGFSSILAVVGFIGQGIIIRALFQAFAEVIRLLRKIAAKP